MRAKLNRSILLDEVTKANRIVDPKAINPETIGICLDLQPEGLNILSTNGAMNWKSIIDKNVDPNIEVEEIGKTLIKGKYFLDVLRKLDDDLVELEIVENNELTIQGGKVRFSLQVLNESQFPLIGFRENGAELNFDPRELKTAISQVLVSINEFNKKMIFTGMNLKAKKDENKLVLYTTDSYRVSKKVVNLSVASSEDIDITIPQKTCFEIVRLLDSCKEAKIIIFEGYILLKVDNHSLFQSTLIDGHFPDVDKAFPKEFNTTIIIKKNALNKSLSRANTTSEEGMTPTVVLDIDENKINYSSSSPEVGNYDEDYSGFEFSGESQKISFNIKFLLDAIRTFDGEDVELKFISSTKPLEIVDHSDDSLEQLILPLILG